MTNTNPEPDIDDAAPEEKMSDEVKDRSTPSPKPPSTSEQPPIPDRPAYFQLVPLLAVAVLIPDLIWGGSGVSPWLRGTMFFIAAIMVVASLLSAFLGLSAAGRRRVLRYGTVAATQVGRNWPFPVALIAWTFALVVSWHLMSPRDSSELMTEWLKIAAQAGAAFFLASGLIYTHRSSEHSRKTLKHQQDAHRQQLERQREEREDARRSEQNERFFNAVQLLGEKDNEGAHIGALFALEQLANESDDHYHQSIEAICAFVRSRSDQFRAYVNEYGISEEHPPAPQDIQVAMTILGRRRMTLGMGEQKGLDLRKVYLAVSEIKGGDYQLADFSGGEFTKVKFEDTNLARAEFSNADLSEGVMMDTILIGTSFYQTVMNGAFVTFTHAIHDPRFRVAVEETHGVGGRLESTYVPPEPNAISDDIVNPGRYLDGSRWFGASLQNMGILDIGFGERLRLDLSQLQLMSRKQFDTITKPDDCIPPLRLYGTEDSSDKEQEADMNGG